LPQAHKLINQREICNGDRTNQTCFRSLDISNEPVPKPPSTIEAV